ncbi:MAG: GntR family transcriptional regulator [Thermaceae bacterium]|nr:GntR family transcriptional regulator [Thermaceae bacterium]
MPIPVSALALERPSLRESVYERLRDWIVEGSLEPGEQLRDQELALRLGVSRTPVREALRRLEDEGLVETASNRWTRVKSVGLEEVGQIYPILLALELLALELALLALNKADMAAMKQANQDLQTALEARDSAKATEADVRFHQVMIERSDNPELIGILSGLKHKYRRLEQAYFGSGTLGKDSPKQHQKLLRALEKRDLDGAKEALLSNWNVKENL